MHVKKGHIEENSVERLLQIVKAGGSQRAMPRKRAGKTTLIGRFKKWCPVPGCDRLVIDVGRHLCNSTYHEFKKGSKEVQRLVRMAKRYTGMVELEDTLIPPPPPIVEQSAVTSDPDVSDTNSEKEEATATQSEAGEESPEEDEDQGQGEEE